MCCSTNDEPLDGRTVHPVSVPPVPTSPPLLLLQSPHRLLVCSDHASHRAASHAHPIEWRRVASDDRSGRSDESPHVLGLVGVEVRPLDGVDEPVTLGTCAEQDDGSEEEEAGVDSPAIVFNLDPFYN